MNPLWIIQTNMGDASDIHKWVEAARASGAEVVEVDVRPMEKVLPHVVRDGPVVVYGMVSFIQEAQRFPGWHPGVFADPTVFTYENWAKHYGDMLLNSPDGVELTTIGQFTGEGRDPDGDIFVRPQHDTKSVVGGVEKVSDFAQWCVTASLGKFGDDVNAVTPILVGTPYGIEAEYRLFVVDGEVVASTMYKSRRILQRSRGAPEIVLEFAKKAIARWNPVDVFTLDVCLSAGNPYIVEAQGFNSAGHYDADLLALVKAVNRVAVRNWEALLAEA